MSRTVRRRASALALAPSCVVLMFTLLLSGCLDYREVLTLAADGSGSLRIDFVVDLAVLSEVSRALGEEPDPQEMAGPTRDEIMAGLDAEGLEVKELDVQEKGQKSKVHALIAFKDLGALAKMEGFGEDRRVDFYDEGEGKVRIVYGFDTDEAIPLEEFSDGEPAPGEQLDETEKKILELTQRARDGLAFRARVALPGRVLKSNGKPVDGSPNESAWVVDKKTDPKRHAVLGKGRVNLMLLVDRASLPFVKELKPLPEKEIGDTEEPVGPRGDKQPMGGLGED
jgi:hypothetical protein